MSLPSPRERMRAGRYGPGERSGLPCGRAGRSALGEGRRARTAQTGRDHLPDHAVFARSNQIRLLEWDSETLYRHVAETVKVFSWGFRPLAERWNGPSPLVLPGLPCLCHGYDPAEREPSCSWRRQRSPAALSAPRGLCADRRLPFRRPRPQIGVDRLVLHAPVRFGKLFRPAA